MKTIDHSVEADRLQLHPPIVFVFEFVLTLHDTI